MSERIDTVNERDVSAQRHTTAASYVIGFVTCVVLSVAAFAIVKQQLDSNGTALPSAVVVAVVVGLALIQLGIQLFCFLHVGHESKPRYNLMTLGFTALVLVILVFGSLWIMNNLNYHLMTPAGMSEFMHENGGF